MIKVAYIFPGQGAQYVGMGKDLYQNFSGAKSVYLEANRVLGFDLADICFSGPEEELFRTDICQPAILTTSLAAWKAWEAVRATSRLRFQLAAAAGLSLGEYSALVCAGSLDFAEAVVLVRDRGRFMEEASRKNPGQMASVIGLSQGLVEEIARESGCEIANLNCPGQVVISGRNGKIEAAIEAARRQGAKRAVTLQVRGPFHSSLMIEAAEKLSSRLKEIALSAPGAAFVANVSAQYLSSPEQIRESLSAQVKCSTRWENSIRLLMGDGIRTYFEIGPGKVLRGLLRRIDPELKVYNIETAEDIRRLAGMADFWK